MLAALFLHLPYVLAALSLHLQPERMQHWRRGRQGGRFCAAADEADFTQVRFPPLLLAFVSWPSNMHFSCTHSIAGNFIGDEGGKAVAAVLPQTKLTSLEYAAAHTVLALMSWPNNMHFFCTHSIASNEIGVEGGKMVAAVLPQTKLTSLKYAAAPTVLAFMSWPSNMHFSYTGPVVSWQCCAELPRT